ncbi:DUF58 domain-containing protein [Natronomonas salina]|uniref:DUF58 domain-containing protein n=1 Tax=Natronomonas salina TaxID=1710540 RepID=UPI0015B3AB41|nr:DUF58 domain-containing protein [Natronomonas salina]QLD88751.1 DUF58 domain-containing protein [Natronomonas salina]
MQPTRRFWETLAVAGVLCAAAVAFAQPLLLLAPAGIAAWLLAAQLGFVYAVGRLDDSLAIGQTLDREAAATGDPVTATLTARGDAPGLRTTVTAATSAGLDASGDREITLGESTSFTVESDIAGTHHLAVPEIEVRDPLGLFRERFERGIQRSLLVEARRPRNVHVGQGGRSQPTTFGEHSVKAAGPGLTPTELREYVAGEPASNIDWKATARLSRPYIRKYEAESNQTTLFVVDARSSLATGLAGETALDYLRTVALSNVTAIQRMGDPLGCYGIDDHGVHRYVSPTNSARGYDLTRRRLRGLTASTGSSRPRRTASIQRRPTQYDTETRFGRLLDPYATARPATDPESNPLQTAVRSAIKTLPESARIVLYTDDTDRSGIREIVREVRRSDYFLEIFLAPTVLFEPDTLADLTAATERYRDFERFRRELANLDHVTSYEVAPQSRIETVLEQERSTVAD